MDYIASLDMGSETMVMALAEVSANRVQLIGVEQVASEGIERGRVKDEKWAKSSVKQLLEVFRQKHGMAIDTLRVSLPATWVKRSVIKVPLAASRSITTSYMERVEREARRLLPDNGREPVTMLPVSYILDDEKVRNPVGRPVRQGHAHYAFYLARESDLEMTCTWLADLGVERVDFYAEVEAVSRALVVKRGEYQNFALVDLGADSTKVYVFQEGAIVSDVELPLGCSAIDGDIHAAFSQSEDTAQQLKHAHGSAIRVTEKNRKVIIPNTKYSVELHALLQIEQCRLEELLEGAIFQIQRSGFYRALSDGILLTGGGCRVRDVEMLMAKLSGHAVRKAVVTSVETSEANREMPEYLTALGLLACANKARKRSRTLFERLFT
ncbi:MAG: pilus assembly protein PilM [Odoribacteraceae bacterium]|jgi:cell division protein FtsA|nr:pilus assembly protein PilM [Odoribacteraceae bacterium]